MRIDAREVRDPVTVIAGALVAGRPLDRLILIYGTQPDGRGAEALDVVQPGRQALEIPAVIEALVSGVEAGDEAVAGKATAVVRRVTILESIRQHEVDDFVLGQPFAIVGSGTRR